MQEGNDNKILPLHHVYNDIRRIERQKLISALYPAGMTHAGLRRQHIKSLHYADYNVPGRGGVFREDMLVSVFQIFGG